MISTPTSDHVWEDVQGDLDGALLVVLLGTVEVLLVVVHLLVVNLEPQRVQEDPDGLAVLLDRWDPASFGWKAYV